MSAGLSLSGLRVGVTRAIAQAEALAAPLRSRGATPVLMPTLAFADPSDPGPLEAALAGLPDAWTGVLLTSTNAVDRVAARLAARGGIAAALRGLRVITAGSATAAALRASGVHGVEVPESFRSEGVLAMLTAEGERLRGTRWLLPRAEEGRDLLAAGLREAGAEVELVVAYRTVAGPPGPVRAALAGGLDVVTFTSGSCVHNLAAILARPLPEALAGVAVASIGPVTSDACRELGLEPAIEPTRARVPALVEALEAWAARRVDGGSP